MSSVFNELQSGIGKSDLLTLSHNGDHGEGWLATNTGTAEVQSTKIEPSLWAGEPASMREAFDLHALSHTIGIGDFGLGLACHTHSPAEYLKSCSWKTVEVPKNL